MYIICMGSFEYPKATLQDCIDFIRYRNLRNFHMIDAQTGEVVYEA